MWPRNCWYVAGFAHEAGESVLARRLLGQRIVIWRLENGELAALEDRCPHRLVPLSTGKRMGDHIECGYHGLRFDRGGACVHVPGQDTLPKAAPVKRFTVAERHGLIWLWGGDLALADGALIPDLHWMDAPGWKATTGYHHFNCDYRLINDNLLDLSHETYIHKHTIGDAAVAESPVVNEIANGIVRAHREMPDIDPPPLFAMAQGHGGRINRWQIAIYMPPGINMTEAGFHGVGTDRATQSFLMRPMHLITPESEHTSHYFWGVARNFRLDDTKVDASMFTAVSNTFDEDRELLEIQDRCLREEGMPHVPQTAVKVDVAPVQGRRLLAEMIRREQEDPTFCMKPALLADDARISMPPVRIAAE